MSGILNGIKIIEMESIGPAPFCGMHLADLGADVIVIERLENNSPINDNGTHDILKRGKRSVALDLKTKSGVEQAFSIIRDADGLIEGMRPGVMERLGLGPEPCHEKNPTLIYGRVTGWGQTGPLAHAAGHDINYLGLSGALWYAGPPGGAPLPPPTLIGDIAGGALYLTIGMLAGIMKARETGQGDVVDAAIVDGAAHMTNLLLNLTASGQMKEKRGVSLLDGPHWYQTYFCADGEYITLGCLEPKFYRLFLKKMDLLEHPLFSQQYDINLWPLQRDELTKIFRSRESTHWNDLLAGTDACFSPLYKPSQAAAHPHLQHRQVYFKNEDVLQARPAPRFASQEHNSRPHVAAPLRGENTADIFSSFKSSEG